MKSALLAGPIVALVAGGCAGPPSRFEYERAAMGTLARVVFYDDGEASADPTRGRERADAAAEAAFARIADLEARLSDWRDDSELAALARRVAAPDSVVPSGPIPVSDDLARVLAAAVGIAERSGGAFDPTVAPLVELWRRARRQGALPADAALSEARERVGFGNLRVDRAARTVELLRRGVKLDLGGIAKGDAAEQALAVLRDHGFERALVALGGDVVAGAPPPERSGAADGSGWIVALAEPGDGEGAAPRHAVRLAHAALSTSGDEWRFVEIGGRRFSHVVDPRTGLGLERRLLVSVLARDGATADALATAACVLGPEAGAALVEATPGAAARITTIDAGEVRACATSRWPPMMDAPSNREPAPRAAATGEPR
jgi:thiamine biosynthesis lipoprotein